jgi:hypothetical protein
MYFKLLKQVGGLALAYKIEGGKWMRIKGKGWQEYFWIKGDGKEEGWLESEEDT